MAYIITALLSLLVTAPATDSDFNWDRQSFTEYHQLSTGRTPSNEEVVWGLRWLDHLRDESPQELRQRTRIYQLAFESVVSHSGRVLDNDGLLRMRMCESSDNYSINTGNGFYGAYQFTQSTWDWVAEQHFPFLIGVRPDQATPLQQDAMTKMLWSMDGGGPGHWPVCSRRV